MKEFLIIMVLFVSGALGLILNYNKIGDIFIQEAIKIEGTPESMVEKSEKDPVAFAKTYSSPLARRWRVLQAAQILDDAYFLAVSKDTVLRYKDTSLVKDESFGHLVLARAMLLRETSSTLGEAFTLFKLCKENFAGTHDGKLCTDAVFALGMSHGMY